MGFFKKDEIQGNEIQVINEVKAQTKENERYNFVVRNFSIFNVDTIQYVIKNFPAMSIEIQNGLNNLSDILEDTINYIEDRSSEIIKKDRDFELSKAYRDKAIDIYSVVQNIGKYVKWMQDEHEKNVKKDEDNIEQITQELKEKNLADENEKLIDLLTNENEDELEIYKDFSLKEPKAFKIENNTVQVDNWDDLLVKTAEILNKQYKKSKNSDKIIREIKPIEKKSTQNSFRDTVIEMLIEYKINLDEFKIVMK